MSVDYLEYLQDGCASNPNTPDCASDIADILVDWAEYIADVADHGINVGKLHACELLNGLPPTPIPGPPPPPVLAVPPLPQLPTPPAPIPARPSNKVNKTSCAIQSYDPNDKTGPTGFGDQKFVRDQRNYPYAVFFENKPEATAAAQTVVITDVIDSTKFDLSTFTLGPITFGDKVVDVPSGEQQFVTAVDLRPANNLIVRIDAGIDLATGIATWRFESIDPITGLPTTDPIAGFLPPNKTSPEGQGSVLFTVQAKSGLASGTMISNKASIVFDTNDPIETPIWSNTIDISSPSSAVEAIAATQATNSFTVKWAGADIDSGMRDYTIFVSVAGGTPTPWLVDSTETSATYTGEIGKTYAFYSVARDNVGNVESAPAGADATTRVTQTSTGGSGGGCTTSGSAPLDLSFGLLLFLAWLAGYSNRKVQRLRL